ncbi:MAG: thioredoxin family protein [Planctomycetia bacterium]|nr:thioredoxin family protein [Planctomycetia bacterium]
MRKYIDSVVLTWVMLVAFGSTSGIAQEVAWNTDIQSAWQTAQMTNRPLLVFVTSSSCPYCRKMESNTLASPAIARRIRSSYVPVVVNAEESGAIAAQLQVRSVPTTIVISPDARMADRLEGYVPASKLQARLESVLKQLGTP